jgi:Zn-dependent protease with chaperone function
MRNPPEFPETALADERTVTRYFDGQTPEIPLSLGYRLALIAVLIAMLTLPLIYLGIIALTSWGIYLYATRGVDLFFPVAAGYRHLSLPLTFLYSAPLLAGAVLLFFMIKPIFSSFRRSPMSVPIGHVENPELFRFIGQLCQLLGAPIPSRVDVQLGVNASAGFRAGFSSMFGNDIMLRIGLPLVAGLNCNEFAAVLAHELGHFRQRAAMRFSYVIGSINSWFARLVYERDGHDYWLAEETNSNGFALITFMLARIAIGFTRGILWLLMICGHALSSFMYRQMEFHADACALAVAGSDASLTLRHKLRVLNFAEEQMATQFRNKLQPKLPDDLSAYIALMAAQCAGETQGRVVQAMAGRKARWYDSHPSDEARNLRAKQANLPGLILDHRPATRLFGDFPKLSRDFTTMVYSFFRPPVWPEQIFHVEAPANLVPDTAEQEALVRSFFGGLGCASKPLLLESASRLTVGNIGDKLTQRSNAKALLASAELLPLQQALQAADARLLAALQRAILFDSGLSNESVPSETDPHFEAAEALETWSRLSSQVEIFENAARDRLLIPLSLLRSLAVASNLANTEQLNEEVQVLLHVFAALRSAFPPLLELRKHLAQLQSLLPHRAQSRSDFLEIVISNVVTRAQGFIKEVQTALGSVSYPFSHARGNVTLIDFARSKEYAADPALMICKEAESHLQMLFALYYQTLGRLITIATQVDQHLENNPALNRNSGAGLRIEKRNKGVGGNSAG